MANSEERIANEQRRKESSKRKNAETDFIESIDQGGCSGLGVADGIGLPHSEHWPLMLPVRS